MVQITTFVFWNNLIKKIVFLSVFLSLINAQKYLTEFEETNIDNGFFKRIK